LNVDLIYCQRHAEALAAECPKEYVIEQGEVLTPQYFDAVAAEVNEVLQETGQVLHQPLTLMDLFVANRTSRV
jgi:hypothetical protein